MALKIIELVLKWTSIVSYLTPHLGTTTKLYTSVLILGKAFVVCEAIHQTSLFSSNLFYSSRFPRKLAVVATQMSIGKGSPVSTRVV